MPTKSKTSLTRDEILERKRAIDLIRAAQYLDVSVAFLRKRIASGELPAHKLGYRTIRVLLSDVEALRQPVVPGTGEFPGSAA
jgi:excisionase family DNA binding protein